VYVAGRLKTRAWQDEAGTPHARTEVQAKQVIFLDGRQPPAEVLSEEEWLAGLDQAAAEEDTEAPRKRRTAERRVGAEVVLFGYHPQPAAAKRQSSAAAWRVRDGENGTMVSTMRDRERPLGRSPGAPCSAAHRSSGITAAG
jgi:single-stranded DNA-binding protein